MVPLTRDDDLALLRTELIAQRAEIARLTRRRRLPRRLLPLLLAALLVALMPLGTLAANPFTDLTGGPHDGNIDAIFNAGITRGCDTTSYCPRGTVTREEMASFLARTAGLGTNPPIANAATAVNATNAQNAQNAAQLGGQNASAYALKTDIPASGGPLVIWYSFFNVPQPTLPGLTVDYRSGMYNTQGVPTQGPSTILSDTFGGGTYDVALPLDIPRTNGGTALRLASYQVCFSSFFGTIPGSGARITQSAIVAQGTSTTATTFGLDTTVRQSAAQTCYEVATPGATAQDAALYLRLRVSFAGGDATNSLTLSTARLTLVP